MSNPAIARILRKVNDPELINKLTLSISNSEFNSLLLEVFSQRSGKITPAELLKAYSQNRFVEPSSLDAIEYLEAELILLKLSTQYSFKCLELSSLAPFGNCSAVALVDQNKVISALRGTEVLSDVTNVLALEASKRRIESGFNPSVINLCSAHRVARAQTIPPIKGFTAHFKLFGAVTAGSDTGNLEFEKKVLLNHFQFYHDYLVNKLNWRSMKIILKELEGDNDSTEGGKLLEHLHTHLKDLNIDLIKVPKADHRYYDRFRFSIDVLHNGQPINLGDGGFVDWSQKLINNKKERMLISGLGLELILKIKKGLV